MRLLFQDEGRFGRISDRRRCWVPLPLRATVGHQVIREYVYALTAVSPADGQVTSLVMPWVDTDTMSVFLRHTARRFRGEVCVMMLDSAGWHRANALAIPDRLRLIPLPPTARNSTRSSMSGTTCGTMPSAMRPLTPWRKSRKLFARD